MTLLLEKNQRLVAIGDSITDAGRTWIDNPDHGGLGEGYVSQVNALLTAVYPELGIEVINVGIGGNTVRDLKRRWQRDVVNLKPDWLSIMIGTNDVWRQFDNRGEGILEEEFANTLNALISSIRPRLKGLVLLTPFLVEKSLNDPFRAKMDQYGAIVKSIAANNETIIVDTQAAYNKVLEHLPASKLAPDRVHPTPSGHLVLAKALLDAIGFEWV